MIERGFFHPERGYWQTIGGDTSVDDYPEGTIEVPLKPSVDHDWRGGAWLYGKRCFDATFCLIF